MKITVERFVSDNDSTLSTVFVDGVFQCFGTEDEFREEKKVGETRVAAGKYDLAIRDVGGFHGRYLHRFGGDFHKGMIQVMNVPDFEYILIHIGNTDDDTDGCLVVGNIAYTRNRLKNGSSLDAYKDLYNLIIDSVIAGNATIEYIDRDQQ
jgi:hypothetical protein